MSWLNDEGAQTLIDQTKDWSYHTVELTNAEYQALVNAGTVDPKIAYYITDAYPEGVGLNHFDRASLYSTTEKMIGQWIDGKPLYQKTYSFVGNGSSTFYFDTNATNIVLVDGFLTHLNPQNGNSHGLPYYFGDEEDASTSQRMLYVVLNSSGETFVNNHRYFATIKYTKSTDTAFDAEWSNPEDYSTTEKIIGTWIDGKPIYQKTYVFSGNGTQYHQLENYWDGFLIDAQTTHTNLSTGNNHLFLTYAMVDSSTLGVYCALYDGASYVPAIFTSGHEYYVTIKYTKS